MAEFFLELFSEEIPANLQQNFREKLLEGFREYFINKSIKTKFFQFHDKKGNQINLSQNSESYQNGIFLGFSDWDGRYSRNSIKSFENPVQGKCITKKIGSFNNCKNGVCIEDFQIINIYNYMFKL